MSATQPTGITAQAASNSFTFSVESNSTYKSAVAAAPVILKITVPAYTIYTIEYNTSFSLNPNAGRTNKFYDSWSEDEITSYALNTWSYVSNINNVTDWVGKHHADGVTYTVGQHPEQYGLVIENNTAEEREITRYAFYSAHADATASFAPSSQVFTIIPTNVTATKIKAPTTTDTTPKEYDGNNKTFAFKYDVPSVTAYGSNITYSNAYKNIETTVEALDFDEDTIASSTYSLSAEGVNRTLTATESGTYKVKFNLKVAAIAGGIEWVGGGTAEKSLTFTIEQQEIDPFLPTVDYGEEADGTTKKYFSGTATSGFPTIKPPTLWEGKGTLVWDSGQVLSTTKDYNWTFTPTDNKNFKTRNGSTRINVEQIAVGGISATFTGSGDIFTSTKLEDVLNRLEVRKTNNDGTDGGIADVSEIQFATGTTLTAGENKQLTVQLKDKPSISCTVTIPEILAVVPAELVITHDGTTVYTSTSADALKGQLTVKIKNNDGTTGKTLKATEYSLPDDFALEDGDFKIEVIYKYSVDGTEKELKGDTTITVAVAGIDKVTIKEVNVPAGTKLWEGDAANTIKQYLTVEVTYDDGNGTKKTLSASDNFTVKVTPANDKNVLTSGQCAFNVIYGGKTSTNVKTVTVSAVLVDTLTPNYTQTGVIYSSAKVEDLNIDTLLSVDAIFNNGDGDTLDKDSYTVTIPDNFSSENNEITVTWKKGDVTKTATFTVTVTDVAVNGITPTYTLPEGFTLDASKGLENLKDGLEVVLSYNNGDTKTLSAEGYTLTADSTHGDGLLAAGQRTITVTYSDGSTATFTVNVAKADVDASGATFKPSAISGLTEDDNGGYKATYDPDGSGFAFTVADLDPASIPAAATPKAPVYKKLVNGNWDTVTEIKEAGEYKVVFEFDPTDPANYNGGIAPVEFAIFISDAVVTGVSAKVEDGAKFDINSTLDDVIAKIKAEIEFNNGTKEEVKVEDLTVTCATLRDGGLLEVGTQTITVMYNDGANDFTTTVEIEVAKVKVALPVYSGSLTYNGNELKPAATDFTGYDGALMSFVESKTIAGLNAGTYKAVFALTDTARYEWATASTTLKKTLFAVAVYDEIVLDPTIERAVDWTLERAVITATIGADGKPVFKSDGISAAAIAQAVGLKFFADEACTQEVAADELAYETSYYMQADLLDETNFKLDSTVAQVLNVPYTTPAKELTLWDKIVKFVVTNWLWLVIAVVALILFITVIALIARAAKKKREREEQRRLEEKEEKKREQEERRLEREERMARLNQQQAMPQMMMPQMMPQMMGGQMQMPQAQQAPQVQAQPQTANGIGDSALLISIENQLSALRSEQSVAARVECEMAKLRAELKGGQPLMTDANTGKAVTVDTLTEIITLALKSVLAPNAQQSAEQKEEAKDATPVCPPDAVMTTVTTTKIDTTKKQASPVDRAAPATRTVVRNYVAPMPVDDGRVFDVGGFYTPADPITDLGLTDETDKKD